MSGELATTQDDLVILVHGTYAADDSDHGDAWWQAGSRAWRQLQDRLPRGARAADRGEVFHWSGANSERERIKAARDFLHRLREYDCRGQSYHLIGHSHGGSVIWHALRLATVAGKPLKYLQSWSTVGTPFLHHRTRDVWSLTNFLNVLLALILLRPAYHTFGSLIQIVLGPWFGWDANHVVQAPLPDSLTILETPVLRVFELLGIGVEAVRGGIRVGSFDSSRGDSLTEYLLTTPEGWLMLLVAMAVVYIYLNLGAFFLGPVLESVWMRSESRLQKKVMRDYRDRWLGIWSEDDEAINGLRATLTLSLSLVSKMEPRERVLFSDHLTLIARPYFWVFAPIYNSLLRPILNAMVRSFLVKSAQGNNRPAAAVVDVSPAPVQSTEHGLPGIPVWLNERVVRDADAFAQDMAPELRKLLSEPNFISGLEAFGDTLSGRELVHTSYFDHPEVIDLLALHVTWAKGERRLSQELTLRQPRLTDWFVDFKKKLGQETVIIEHPSMRGSDGLDPETRGSRRRPAKIVPRRRGVA